MGNGATPTFTTEKAQNSGSDVQTITSMEVAKMVRKQHKNLVRDIRGYVEELSALKNEESNSQLKIEPSDFFQEKTYSSRGKEYPCYDVTKKGCEFIAHKLTGIKGTEFTARYINRFHDMEGKRHDHLIRDIKKYIAEINAPNFGEVGFKNRPRRCH